MEDLTCLHSQTHIGRVCILVREKGWVNGSAVLRSEDVDFPINVMEDCLEIIDFGPRYEVSRCTMSEPPHDERSLRSLNRRQIQTILTALQLSMVRRSVTNGPLWKLR